MIGFSVKEELLYKEKGKKILRNYQILGQYN
jgi:hypothetical protein